MSSKPAQELAATAIDEQAIGQYLQQHPDLFDRHPQLLTRLRLVHPRTGTTVSLIERQVEVLREKQAASEQKLTEFVRVARANDALADKIHRFTRRLLRTSTRAQALAQVEAGLREDFDASHAVMVLQAPGGAAPAAEPPSHFLRLLAADDPIRRSFESLFSSGRPRCGQVRDSQRDFLFGNEASAIASVALIPLTALAPHGLLAIGSTDRDHFHPGMSTEFLARMAELIADALARA
ncbi:MAG: DUF484 family protein [Gammaproteobacteria bacterium]|nr:DUF484 family protein [Gammaproteobacteria bacterium]MDE2252587.1 DUF484 family protein [Gammaproteobacteria bacterium]